MLVYANFQRAMQRVNPSDAIFLDLFYCLLRANNAQGLIELCNEKIESISKDLLPDVIALLHAFVSTVDDKLAAKLPLLYSMGLIDKALYADFIPIGSDCSLGTFQRLSKIEPMSLFRWSGPNVHSMTGILNSSLDGFLDKHSYTLRTNTGYYNVGDEYILYNKKYEIYSHTFKYVNKYDKNEIILDQLSNHFIFLARKLKEDLINDEKYFVFYSEDLIDSDMYLLLDAIKKWGEKKLIFLTTNRCAGMYTCSDYMDNIFIADVGGPMDNSKNYNRWRFVLTFAKVFFAKK